MRVFKLLHFNNSLTEMPPLELSVTFRRYGECIQTLGLNSLNLTFLDHLDLYFGHFNEDASRVTFFLVISLSQLNSSLLVLILFLNNMSIDASNCSSWSLVEKATINEITVIRSSRSQPRTY